jgi:DNA-directed RNA polymerase subunit L
MNLDASKIEIKPVSWDKDLMSSRLEFEIKGVSHTIINTFRRIILGNIPIYSFNNITISENTSVFNNNYMKLRISNMPVFGIQSDNPIYIAPKKEVKEKEEINDLNDIDINPQDDIANINSSSLKLLTMYLDYYNNTEEIITVGTDDCKFYYIEKQISSPYPKNIPIIKLQPKQKFKMSAITELGIEEKNSIYSPVSIFSYKELSEDHYLVMIESRGQLDEKKIIQYAYDNIKMILDNFLQLVVDIDNDNSSSMNTSGKFQMNNGDHTLGNLIAEGLQSHKKIKFAGYNCPHLLDKKIIFNYELNNTENSDIKQIIKEIIKNYHDVFFKINKIIQEKIK